MPGRNTVRLLGQIFAAATVFSATPSVAEQSARPIILVSNETKSPEPDTDLLALMSGNCRSLKIAGRDFKCKVVAFVHSQLGRTNFTVALEDPADGSHIISFSGENGQRKDDLYELPVDRMLLIRTGRRSMACQCPSSNYRLEFASSLEILRRDRSPVSPASRQITAAKIMNCSSSSDGLPITVRRIRPSPPTIRHPIAETSLTEKLVEPDAVAPSIAKPRKSAVWSKSRNSNAVTRPLLRRFCPEIGRLTLFSAWQSLAKNLRRPPINRKGPSGFGGP